MNTYSKHQIYDLQTRTSNHSAPLRVIGTTNVDFAGGLKVGNGPQSNAGAGGP